MLVVLAMLAATPDPRLAAAISRYESAQFAAARDALIDLLDRPELTAADRADARCYLAASYLALTDRSSARLQLRELARENPSAKPSPATFPPDLVALANEVRADAEKRRAQEIVPPVTPAPAPVVEARTDARPNRALAFVPLGVGHFARGAPVLGIVWLGLEALLAAVAVGSVWKLESLKLADQPRGVFSHGTYRAEDAAQANTLNGVSTATFFTAIAAAVIDVVIGNVAWPSEAR